MREYTAELGRLRGELHSAAVRQIRRRRRKELALLVAVAVGAIATGVGLGSSAWVGSDVTPADIHRQATVVTNDKWGECGANGCVTKTGSHLQVQILPAMGVSFVLPSGAAVNIVSATGVFGPGPTYLDEERARYGLPGLTPGGTFREGTVRLTATGGSWEVSLDDGTTRTITWRRRDGSMQMLDRAADGAVSTTRLHAGDVVELALGSIPDEARTLEKAVTFDLPSGIRVHILPTFNEAYVGFLPSLLPPSRSRGFLRGTPTFLVPQVIARSEAERWGLTPTGDWNARLPTGDDGGTWTVDLPEGTRRTISWEEGDRHVTIRDNGADEERTVDVPIGHELPLVPFR